MKRSFKHSIVILLFLLLIGGVIIAGCTTPSQTAQNQAGTTPVATEKPVTTEKPKLLLATTTSLYDTGLLNYLEPKFEAKYNVDLLITSQGTGKAIELAKQGDADVLLVHSPSSEMTFLEDGYGLNRRTFAYNYFMIVGPANDPAGIKGKTPEEAFTAILTQGKAGKAGVMFVSRGDASGTHTSEQSVWKAAKYTYATDVQKSGNWYIEAGKGMGETLQMASEKGAYTYTDEGTFLAYQGKLNLVPLVTQGSSLMNLYSVMTVYPANPQPDKIAMSNNFINWLISSETLTDIGNYGKDKYGKGLFTPMTAGVPKGVTADFTTPATATRPLKVYHAGSLQSSFGKLEKMFEKAHPDVDVQLFSGGSGALVDKVNKQNQKADVLASADYSLISKYLYPLNATSYVNFAKNTIVLCYTDQSKYAQEINKDNWYMILGRDGVSYAISDPKTDPAGYRSLMTIGLAEGKYNFPFIFDTLVTKYSKIKKTSSKDIWTIDVTTTEPDGKKLTITPTGPDITPLLKDGKVDYAFEYSSVAVQSGLKYIKLPSEIDLSDPNKMSVYQTMQVKRPSGSTTVTEVGMPIIYAVTVPVSARTPDMGYEFTKLLISSDGQALLNADGQTPIVPAEAYGSVPDALKQVVTVKV
ncbi:MAG: tungstate ABC transporter substrate-binding protein WtpA [Methanoregula sp.]|nr:tungstate ABC transporter substrate-binding protein WtpA [Methanoregula sp.]